MTQINSCYNSCQPTITHVPRKPEDERLIMRFLARIGDLGLSQNEVEDRVPGVTQSDVSRWANGNWTRITGAKRRAVLAFLEIDGTPQPRGEGLTGFPVQLPPESASLDAHLTGEKVRARASGHADPAHEAFERVDEMVQGLRARGEFSDAGYAYWRAVRLGAIYAEGYVPVDPDPVDPQVNRSDDEEVA